MKITPRRKWLLVGGATILALVLVAMAVLIPPPEPAPVPSARTSASSPAHSELAAVVTAPPSVAASPPPEPTTRLYFDSDRAGQNYEVYVALPDGSDARQLTRNPDYDSWWARPSPDGRWVLFYRSPRGVHDKDYGKVSLWRMRPDGSDQRQLLAQGSYGWDQQGHAEWSPDSQHLVMFGGSKINPQLFITAADGTQPRQLTNRGGTNIDPSWSPDGQTIVFTACPGSICFPKDYEIYTVKTDGSDVRRLTDNQLRDHDAYFSPDGKQIAWLVETDPHGHGGAGTWNIYLMNADGTQQRNLTNDEEINSKPSWARDGSGRILFMRLPPGGTVWQLFGISPDGKGLKPLVQDLANDEFPAE